MVGLSSFRRDTRIDMSDVDSYHCGADKISTCAVYSRLGRRGPSSKLTRRNDMRRFKRGEHDSRHGHTHLPHDGRHLSER